MRGDSAGKPELREKHIEYAEQPCYARAASDQCIHVGRAVSQLSPCISEETASEPEHHRCGECEKQVFHPRHIHECHPEHHDRDGQGDGRYSPAFQFTVMFLMDPLRLIVKVFFRIGGFRTDRSVGILFCRMMYAGGNQQVVSCIPDSLAERFRGTFSRVELHLCSGGGIIDGRGCDPVLSIQSLVHT